jgi:hypothetical protein
MTSVSFRLLALWTLVTSACSSTGSSAGGSNDSGPSVNDGAGLDSSDALAPVAQDAASPDGSGDTWGSWAAGFFSTYCVECHSASDPTGLDFTMQSIVVQNKLAIRCGVCNVQDPSWGCPASPHAQQFPISNATGSNPKPSAADRDRVVAWITAGCP